MADRRLHVSQLQVPDVTRRDSDQSLPDVTLCNWQGLHPDREIMFVQVSYIPGNHGNFTFHIFWSQVPQRTSLTREVHDSQLDAPVSTGNNGDIEQVEDQAEENAGDEAPELVNESASEQSLHDSAEEQADARQARIADEMAKKLGG